MASFLQRIFRRPDYRSDITQFIDQLRTERPDLEAQQRAGRSIWWDKNLDRDLERGIAAILIGMVAIWITAAIIAVVYRMLS